MRMLFLALFALVSSIAIAQYDIENPYVSTATCSNIKIEEVHVYPDKITIDFVFEADARASGFRYPSTSYIQFKDYKETSKVTGVKNVEYNTHTYLKVGKKANFSATFPFSFYYMLEDNAYEAELSKKFHEFPFLKMDVIDCSDSYLKNNPKVDKSLCFNFYGINLNLKPDQVEALYLCGLLDDELIKDEFETTAAYNKRTSPDSLSSLLKSYIADLEKIYTQKQINQMALGYPAITYDADKEMFSIKYTNADPFLLKMSIDKAPAFKKAIQSGATRIKTVLTVRKPDGTYYIKQIRFEEGNDSKNTAVYSNSTEEDIQKYYDDTVKRVLTELKKIYSKGQIWK